jgi:hypothetical protein
MVKTLTEHQKVIQERALGISDVDTFVGLRIKVAPLLAEV